MPKSKTRTPSRSACKRGRAGRSGWLAAGAVALALHAAPGAAQSLWKDESARNLVADKRAHQIGDIVTILIQESNSTIKNNSTSTDKKSGLDASIAAFLYSPNASPLLTKKGQLPALKYSAAQNFSGGGKIDNLEKISARIAVRVVDVLPNGNLVIEGTKSISFSGESQDAVLRGVVRVEDITASNTVFSYNVADASIRYVSKGTVSDAQRKGWLIKIWDKLTPF